MAYYGYIRVSTKGQVPGTSLAEQEQQIKERYPTATIVKEAASGAHERQAFDNLCKTLQAGDTLVVCKMDRFCRSAKEGLQYVDLLRDKGVAVHILNMGLLDNSPMGRLVATMLLAFAEFERAQIIQRTKSFLTLRQRIVFRMMCLRPLMQPRMIPSVRSVWSSWPICFCRTRPTTARRAYFSPRTGAR